MKLLSLLFVGIFLLFGCAHKPEEERPVNQKKEVLPSLSSLAKIWVMKSDGSKQCGFEKASTPDEAAANLQKAGITVYEKRRGSDGMMHTMNCGSSTGNTIELQIDEKDFSNAKKQGYSEKH